MFSGVRGIVSRPSVVIPRSMSQSAAVRTMVLPTPVLCRSGRTASGPIHPSARAGRGVVGNANDAVEPVTHLLDVGDENDLREAIAQPTQQREHMLAPRFIERSEDFVEHEQ